MKLLHLTFILFIFFSSLSQAKVNQLDDQDKQAVHQLVKNLTDKLFLLESTQYQSKKLQKELLKLMPNKIAAESEYEPMSKKKYIYFSIKSGKHDKNIIYRRIRDDITPKCQYIKDGTIDCDLKERIKYIEKSNSIPKKPIEYVAGKEYKFNLKMNETGDWYINKMKTWNMVPAPRMSTLEIEEKYRQEELKNKRVKSNSKIRDKDENDIFPTRATRRSDDVSRSRKMTDVELAEEEAEKEEQKRLLQELQEQLKIKPKTKNGKIYDINGNIIKNDINKVLFDKRIHSRIKSRERTTHPIYGSGVSSDRGKKWVPYYAANYAIQYAENYNPDYKKFFNDCANFVSQALTWGGWQNDTGWYTSDHAWWYNPYSQSYTWAGASNLHKYIQYQITQGNVVWRSGWWKNLRRGDVLALTMSRTKKTADHMMMVTSFHNGEIYVSGHTSDRKNKPLSKVDPYYKYFGWGYHIKYGNLR